MELEKVLELVEKENQEMVLGMPPVFNTTKDLYYKAFTHNDIECCVIRTKAGHLCGYIKLQVSKFNPNDFGAADEMFDAFYGVTYVNNGWIGFDCAHVNQMSPYNAKRMNDSGYSFDVSDEEYISLDRVIEKVKELAAQESNYLLNGN